MPERNIYVADHEVCAFCSDSECDGIGCIARLDPNDEADHPEIERLHDLIRAGDAFRQTMRLVTEADGRTTHGGPQ